MPDYYPVYCCTNPGHGYGEHDRSCMPLDPDDLYRRRKQPE